MEAKIKSLFSLIIMLGILSSGASAQSIHIYCENKYERCANKCMAVYGNGQGCYNKCDIRYNRCLNKLPRVIDPNVYIQPYVYGIPQHHYWRSYPRQHHWR